MQKQKDRTCAPSAEVQQYQNTAQRRWGQTKRVSIAFEWCSPLYRFSGQYGVMWSSPAVINLRETLYSFAAAMASTLIHMASFSGMLVWKKRTPLGRSMRGSTRSGKTRRRNHAVFAATNECAPGHTRPHANATRVPGGARKRLTQHCPRRALGEA